MSASLCEIAWKRAIGPPNALRSRAYAAARSSAAWAMPTACAAMPIRPPSSVASAMRIPPPGGPSGSHGVASKDRSAVDEECRPIFSSSRVTRKPSAPRRTTKAETGDGGPACPGCAAPASSASCLAKTLKTWACEPLVIHCLVPVMRPSSQRVSIDPASLPLPGSVSA